MAQYLVAIHHPDNYDPSREDKTMERDIDALNDEMVAAGVRVFVGGLLPGKQREVAAGTIRWQGAHHRRTLPGNQGAHRRFLGRGSRKSGRGAGVGPQGRLGLSRARRGTPVWHSHFGGSATPS